MARLNPHRLLGLVLVVLAVCSQAASTDRISSRALRRVAVRKEVDIVKKSEEIFADFKAKIKQQLVDPKFPQNYLAERKYYIEWTTVIMFGLLETNLGLPKGSLKDKTTVPPNLDRTEAAVMAKVAYETRHFLRNAIRQREEQRPCMAAVVKLLRFRDLLVYGSGEGPSLPQLIARKYGKMKPPQPPPQDYTQLPKDVALSLVFSAASPNYYVNALTNFIAQKTGNTLSNEQRTHFMQHAGLSQDQIDQVLGAVANQAGACSPADKADAMVIDFLLKDGNYNENNDDDDGALFVMPKSKVF